jgi:NtrC-family two-component system response regulator AlgB
MSTAALVRTLVIDDEESIRRMLRLCLESAGHAVQLASTADAGLDAARRSPPDLVLLDLRLGDRSGLDVLRALRQEAPGARVVLMTAYATIDSAVEAMRLGAIDYLPKPFTPDQLLHTVQRVLDSASIEQELAEIRRASPGKVQARFDGRGPAIRDAMAVAGRVAPTDATVMLLGETGTGKGMLARQIHALSPRKGRPFVTVNCAVVSPTLVENELFGHARGAFTGADSARAGHIEAAGNGTLFLDEVGDLPREVQGKLLRLLEEREYVRVGDTTPRRSEARVIAATHRDLKAEIGRGAFREDLYYRLNVVTIRLPPLRERRDDIPALAAGFVAELGAQHRRPGLTLAPALVEALVAYSWPGNLRELVNVLERAVILSSSDQLTPDLLPEEIGTRSPAQPGSEGEGDENLAAIERRTIAAALARYPTLDGAARALGIDPSTLYRKRERYGLR